MKHISKRLKSILKDESAQGATEYILLLVVVVGIVALLGPKIRPLVEAKIDQLSGMIQEVGQ